MKKKTNRKLYTTNTTTDMEYSKIIKIGLGVLIVLALVYFVTAILTGEIKFGNKKETEKVETSIQYEEIIKGQVLNRNDDEYYVLFFNFTDNFASYYLSLKDNYSIKDNSLPVYILDLEKHSNSDLLINDGEDYKQYPNNINELKVNSPTLLKISNHTVVGRISGRDGIIKFFSEN